MNKEQAKKLPNYKTINPLGHLSDYVKDPRNKMRIERALLETLSCKKSHSGPLEMMDCLTCQDNAKERRLLMAKFGFRSPAELMAWRKTHQDIKDRMPLDMYNRMINGPE